MMAASKTNFELFLDISAVLTGFNEAELQGTGMLECYYNTILEHSNRDDIKYFFQEVDSILNLKAPSDKPTKKDTEAAINSAISSRLMPDNFYNGLAKSIINLWYTGNWGNEVVTAESYIQGLMWNAGHTHPPGAKQPGYGSWALAPIS